MGGYFGRNSKGICAPYALLTLVEGFDNKMAPKPKTETETASINIPPLQTGEITFCGVGTSPIIYHAMSAKGVDDLLFPSGRKTEAEKQATLKHHPYNEYRASVYQLRERNGSAPLLMFPCGAFKAAMEDAAVDCAGIKKAQVQRRLWIAEKNVPIWGVPQIYLTTVRNSDINRTPDIRSRAILPQWAFKFTVTYVKPVMSDAAVSTLLANAGVLCGIGDNRQQKGGGYGQFRLCAPNDPEFKAITKLGYVEQARALEEPVSFDVETERALSVWNAKLEAAGDKYEKLELVA